MSRFTFTDLVVATLLVMLTVGVLVPAAIDKKEEANRVECQSHLSQIGRALLLYSNENKGSFPRTKMKLIKADEEVKLTFFTNPNIAKVDDKPADTDPFGDKGPEVNDVTGALYLLLRTQDLEPRAYLCPSVTGEVAFMKKDQPVLRLNDEPALDFAKQTNFASPKYLDYSFLNVYPSRKAIGTGYKTFITAFSSDFAIAADLNPGAKELTKLTPKSPAADLKASNSANHNGDGQNVLYADGHAEFQRTPLCGVGGGERKAMDNIYTYGMNSDAKGGDGIVGDPVDAVDSVLVPSAVECLAAMPKAEKK
jgi:prepilin-type processing-associated H-X9-DG protein